MSVCSSNSLCSINAVVLKGHAQLLMSSNFCDVRSQAISSSCSFRLYQGQSEINHAGPSTCTTYSCPTIMGQTIRVGYLGSCCTKQKGTNNIHLSSSIVPWRTHHKISLACQSMNMRLLVTKPKILHKVRSTVGAMTWPRGRTSAGFFFGLLVCNSSSEPINAEAASENGNERGVCNESCVKFSHGKKVYTDYYVIGIPGDGRCLFRSVAHGACLRSGKPPSSERLQRELADELRGQVADEFIKRRKETEWFVEGDFDTYVSQIRKPHVWGGEPELFIASHVLQVPITVYMYDQDAGGLISIAEYGQEEYGMENPVRVLYHGFGHYDALELPRRKGPRPRL